MYARDTTTPGVYRSLPGSTGVYRGLTRSNAVYRDFSVLIFKKTSAYHSANL